MLNLLEKIRKVNKVLQKAKTVEYDSISRVLSNVIDANVFVVDNKGKLYGYAFIDEFEKDTLVGQIVANNELPRKYVNWLLTIDSSMTNISSEDEIVPIKKDFRVEDIKYTTVVPIYGIGERIGSFIITRFNKKFADEDLLLAEYGATVIGMEILHEDSQKKEKRIRNKISVQIAIQSLSYSEMEAAYHILTELAGNDGLLVASRIADKIGITRSVIVNSLRKLESAGVIETKSLGMKGTFIKIKNPYLIAEIRKSMI